MRVLMLANMIYALVLPVIEIFVAAYVMRNSHAVSKVVTYQLAIYAVTPIAFYLNGRLLGHVAVRHLYAAGMLLSGVSMMLMMRSTVLTPSAIAASGMLMGMATGLFWANRGFLALATTNDGNRNYFYGVELFVATVAAVIVPAAIGWFIGSTTRYGWLGGNPNHAYRIVTAIVCALTLLASILIERGEFYSPGKTRFVYFRFDPLWYRMMVLAFLKGLAQGYIVTAPAMLIMMFVGEEGTLGATQAIGGVISAFALYAVGRMAQPQHRLIVFATGLTLFAAGSIVNAILFDAKGVLIFMACLLLAKPLLDLAYFPIQLHIIDAVSRLERRNQYAYIFNHEFGLFAGRCLGCGLFLVIANYVSGTAALKYALPAIAIVQMLSIVVARQTLAEAAEINANAVTEILEAETLLK